jgi:hypothetical protein
LNSVEKVLLFKIIKTLFIKEIIHFLIPIILLNKILNFFKISLKVSEIIKETFFNNVTKFKKTINAKFKKLNYLYQILKNFMIYKIILTMKFNLPLKIIIKINKYGLK